MKSMKIDTLANKRRVLVLLTNESRISPGRGPQVAAAREGGAECAGLATECRVVTRGGQPVSVPEDKED